MNTNIRDRRKEARVGPGRDRRSGRSEGTHLSGAGQQELLTAESECRSLVHLKTKDVTLLTFGFAGQDGWPCGVVMSYIVVNGTFRLTGPRAGRIDTHAYFQATMLKPDQRQVVIGVYDDLHVEQGGKLKIAHKKITVERVLELPAALAHNTYVGTSA